MSSAFIPLPVVGQDGWWLRPHHCFLCKRLVPAWWWLWHFGGTGPVVSCADCATILDLVHEIAHWPLHVQPINLVRADIVAITARLKHIREEHGVPRESEDFESDDTLEYDSEGNPYTDGGQCS